MPDSSFSFDAPQRPSQSPQRDDLVFLFLVQDVAHIDGAYPPSINVLSQFLIGRFSGDLVWPVLGDPRGSPASDPFHGARQAIRKNEVVFIIFPEPGYLFLVEVRKLL